MTSDAAMAEQALVILLLKLAVAASIASILVRFEAFKRTLMRDERTFAQQFRLSMALSSVLVTGVAIRILTGVYKAADIGLEGCFLAGLVGGYFPGLITGVLVSLPAMIAGEMLTMPLFAAIGVLGGLMRDAAPSSEEIWKLSPFPDLNLYRALRNWEGGRLLAFQFLIHASIIVAELLRFLMSRYVWQEGIFSVYPEWQDPHLLHYLAIWATTMFSILLPLKIWANARTERQLEMQAMLLQEARLRALTSQINPHFLFNTLNSIASLVRTNPDGARTVIVKLSNILRRLMRKNEALVPLREELNFIDDYLSIEMVRFGPKLRFIKEVSPEALDAIVPSMLLQPIVENSLKHGLSNKVEGGSIWLRAKVEDGRLHLMVEDDGVGIAESRLAKLFEQGIGVSNVNERLQVLFGDEYKIWVDSRQGEGTRTGIEIPGRTPGLAAAS
jgi:two-component system, LytTR family, sensor kinase